MKLLYKKNYIFFYFFFFFFNHINKRVGCLLQVKHSESVPVNQWSAEL